MIYYSVIPIKLDIIEDIYYKYFSPVTCKLLYEINNILACRLVVIMKKNRGFITMNS